MPETGGGGVRPRSRAGSLAAVAGVLLAGLLVFGPVLSSPVRWRTGDWGAHHVLTGTLAGALEQEGRIPHWVLRVSSGSPSFETYPVLTYVVAAGATLFFDMRDRIPLVLLLLGLAAHLALAVGVTRVALRLGHWAVAALLGVLFLVDLGGFEGGVEAVLGVGLLHAAVAQCFTLAAFVAALDFLARPRPFRAGVLWVTVALGAAAHPSSLFFVAASMPALALTAVLSRDVRPRRALALAAHLALGALLSAWSWWPLSQRVLRHGSSFAFASPPPGAVLEDLLSLRAPATSFPFLLALGLVGVVAGLVSRRAAPTLVAATVLVLLAGYSDVPWLLLGGSPELARMQTFRFLALARPLLFAAAAHAVTALAMRRRPGERSSPRWVVAGALAVAALVSIAPEVPGQVRAVRARAASEVPDPEGFRALVGWARVERGAEAPDRFSRLLYEGDSDSNWISHVTAEAGLPALLLGDGLAMLDARERMEDASPESLRRFDVRWVARKGGSPTLGEPSTERRFGRYFVREWPEWDGRLARVERGGGEVRVVSLSDERVELVLSGTDAPALVALGTGYFPRWRARDGAGREFPVYAVPSAPDATTHVVAGWLPPGRATFTADGALPSAGSGRWPSAAAALLAAAFVASSRQRRWTGRRALVRADRAWRRARRAVGATLMVVLTLVAAFALGRASSGPARAVQLGLRWSGGTGVEARPAGSEAWVRCRRSLVRRGFDCGGLGRVADGLANAIANPRTGGNTSLTPAITVASRAAAEFRIRVRPRLEGGYATATIGKGAPARLTADGRPLAVLTRRRSRLAFEGTEGPVALEIALTTPGPGEFGVTVVREDTLEPEGTAVPLAPEAPPF